MKIFEDNNGYITSMILLMLLLIIILLLIITIDEQSYYINNTAETIESNKLTSVTRDFQEEIPQITKQTLSNITRQIIEYDKPLTNSRTTIKNKIQKEIDDKEIDYKKKTGCNINCEINNLNPSENPFQIEIEYTIKTTYNNKSTIKITKQEHVSITDSQYPIYDPLPTLQTGIKPTNNNIHYGKQLQEIINTNNSQVYDNATQGYIIRECPYQEYEKHGHNNTTIMDCINNHYYHKSHDGLCIFCRLENKTTCNDMGLETFILPTKNVTSAPVSVDHVLLNTTQNSKYPGNRILINNTTVIYLDDGHKTKYGL